MSPAETLKNEATLEEIARLAYEIWQQSGSKPGTDLHNWLLAEKQLKAASKQASGQSASADESEVETGNAKSKPFQHATNASVEHNLARH